MRDTLFHILFVWYPYVCIGFFVVGSLFRFERDQYSWRASSSQLLRRKQLAIGSASQTRRVRHFHFFCSHCTNSMMLLSRSAK